MKISVIVPVYNVEDYVERCIESIMDQSYRDIEIILVDDGSTDRSGAICDKYADRNTGIMVLHQENVGVVSSRKAGARVATGDYIASVDGDDWIERDYLKNFYDVITGTGRNVAWSVSYYKDSERFSELCIPDRDFCQAPDRFREKILDLVKGTHGFQNEVDYSIWNKCIQRRLYTAIQNKVPDGLTRGEDLYFSVLLLSETENISFCRNDGYHYVQRASSNTNNLSAYSRKSFDILQENLRELSVELKGEARSLRRIIQGYLASTYMLYFLGDEEDGKVKQLCPFRKMKKHSKVVIYGSGQIGRNIMLLLENSGNYEVLAWLDSRSYGKVIRGWRIAAVSSLPDLQYDYIILATNRTMYIREMKENLKKLGMLDERVVSAFDDTRDSIGQEGLWL